MSETLHEMAVRMCRGRCGYDCTGCPVRTEIKGMPCLISSLFYTDNADEQIEALKRWAEEHPKKTWLSVFYKALPNSMWAKNPPHIPTRCPRDYLGGNAPSASLSADLVGGCCGDCKECWNSEVIEE